MKTCRLLASLAASLSLTACQTTQPSAISETLVGETAKLRVVAYPRVVNSWFKGWPDRQCQPGPEQYEVIMGELANALFSRGTDRRLGIPLIENIPPTQTSEMLIEAMSPYHGYFKTPSSAHVIGAAISYDWCTKHFTFLPAAGAMYEITFRSGAESRVQGSCSVELVRIATSDSGQYIRIPDESLTMDTKPCK